MLARGLGEQREEVERLVAGLEVVARDLEEANKSMAEVMEGNDMRMETGEMEEELRTVGRERGVKL